VTKDSYRKNGIPQMAAHTSGHLFGPSSLWQRTRPGWALGGGDRFTAL
jgi:hypothetical protein